jgi:hypothetical protein
MDIPVDYLRECFVYDRVNGGLICSQYLNANRRTIMNDLSLAGAIYDMADELAASNDRAEAVMAEREAIAERCAANRKLMNPSLDESKVGQPRPCNTGSIVGCFIKNYAARR